jgi:heme-degrading monooxygenase HmoA
MFSVIFEVNRKPDRAGDYLELAQHLKPILAKIDGFIDNERFESNTRPGWLLSHSTWRDEKSVIRWRTQGEHHRVQEKGRFEIFQDYHLRVGEVVSDTAPPLPIRESRLDETETASAKYATLTEITPASKAAFASASNALPAHLGLDTRLPGCLAHDIFESIVTPGKFALLVSWKDAKAASAWAPTCFEGVETLRHRRVRVIRDYGMFDRREAPQFYAAAVRD